MDPRALSRAHRDGSIWPAVLVASGAAAVTGLYFWNRKKITSAVENAVALPPGAPSSSIKARLTTYYPFQKGLTDAQRKMEGGPKGAAGWPKPGSGGKRPWPEVHDPATGGRVQLATLEMHLSDPARYPFCACAGDPSVWPFGQRVAFDAFPRAVFRIVDTGGNFKELNKVVRVAGLEPIDICVNTTDSRKQLGIPQTAEARIVSGDNWQRGAAVAFDRAGKSNLAGQVVDGYTTEDADALARAVSPALRLGDAAARAIAWTCRNRAARGGRALSDALLGEPFCALDANPGAEARRVADDVLGASADPTGGAIDFWLPAEQSRLKARGDVYRKAAARGDLATAAKYAGYADYDMGEAEVRAWQERVGLVPSGRIGPVEFLRVRSAG